MTLIKIDEGDDVKYRALRHHVPEPSRVENKLWRLYAYKREPIPVTEWTSNIIKLTIPPQGVEEIVFEKRLIICDGVSFHAWVCLRDGKIYF